MRLRDDDEEEEDDGGTAAVALGGYNSDVDGVGTVVVVDPRCLVGGGAVVVDRTPLPPLLALQYKFSTSGSECFVHPRSTLKAAYWRRVASP